VTRPNGSEDLNRRRLLRKHPIRLYTQVLLRYPDFSKPFDIITDASYYQLVAVIAQESWPIVFYSRKLKSTQRNYTTMEKELLSIVETAQHYRHILLGRHCTFHCDHKNLGFQNFKSERVRRWHATLEEFQYGFVYYPGKDNYIADMLSQYLIPSVDTSTYEEVTTLQDSSFPAMFDTIAQSQISFPNLHDKLTKSKVYSIVKKEGLNIIYRNDKIVIDLSLFHDILAWYHINLNHPGQDCTYCTINTIFYTPNMEAQIRQYVDKCQVCRKPPTKNMDSYLTPQSTVNRGRSFKLTCLALGLFMMLTKSHTKYREYPSLTLQHVGLSYVSTLPNTLMTLQHIGLSYVSTLPNAPNILLF
jgi:hypothetical protein